MRAARPHTTPPSAPPMSRSWAGGSTRRWRRLRAFILWRDGYQCRAHADGWCDQAPGHHTCTQRAELTGPHAGHAHHTLGRAITGDDPRHIVAACAPCNLHIGDPTRQGADPACIFDPKEWTR